MNPTIALLQGVLANAVGPGATPGQIQRVQLWDLWSQIPFYNDSNLAGYTTGNVFNYKANDAVSGPGFVAGTSPAYTMGLSDTNIDSPGNVPFDIFIHGISLDIINKQQTSGTVGSANDMAAYSQMKAAYLQDIRFTFNLNNNDLDLFPMSEAPAAAGAWLAASQGTSAALTTGASVTSVVNGWPSATNYRNYLSEGPFYCPQNTTIKGTFSFGPSILAANTVYQPAHTGAPALFLKATLRGFRIWYAS